MFMAKAKKDENEKTFSDRTLDSWFYNENNIKIGKSFAAIMKGESETLEVKEIIVGDTSQSWFIVVTTDDKLHLLKTSRELK
jgi:hypothetical protein